MATSRNTWRSCPTPTPWARRRHPVSYLLIALLIHARPARPTPLPLFCGNGVAAGHGVYMDVMVPCRDDDDGHHHHRRHHHHNHERGE